MSPSKQSKALKRAAAQAKFVRAICEAVAEGVDVDASFLAHKEQIMLAWVRCFGLTAGICYMIVAPYLPPAYRILCFKVGVPYELNELYYYWPFLVSVISVISFGFNLVDPRNLKRVTGKPKMNSDETVLESRLSESAHHIIPRSMLDGENDGDV